MQGVSGSYPECQTDQQGRMGNYFPSCVNGNAKDTTSSTDEVTTVSSHSGMLLSVPCTRSLLMI